MGLCQRCQKNEQPMLHTWTSFPTDRDASLWLLCDTCDSTALALLEGRPVFAPGDDDSAAADLVRAIGEHSQLLEYDGDSDDRREDAHAARAVLRSAAKSLRRFKLLATTPHGAAAVLRSAAKSLKRP